MGHASHVQGAQIKLLGMQETRGEIGLAEGRRGLSDIGLHITFYKTSTDGAEDDALSTWTAITCLYFLHIEAGRVFGLQGRVREDPTMSSNSKPITSDQNFVTTHQTQPAMQCTPPPLYVVLQQQSIYSEQAFFCIFKGHIIIDDGILLLQHIIDDG